MSEIEDLRAEVERLRQLLREKESEVDDKSRLGHAIADAWERRAEAAEARLRKVEALADLLAANGTSEKVYYAETIRAALAEGAKHSSPPEAEGSGSAEPAEVTPPAEQRTDSPAFQLDVLPSSTSRQRAEGGVQP